MCIRDSSVIELEKDSAAGAMHDGGAELDIGDLMMEDIWRPV